jgi:hypothetical protein
MIVPAKMGQPPEKASRGMGGADNLSKDEIRAIARMLPKIPGCTPTEG